MLQQQIREYFSFTRKERIGVIFLVIIIIALFIVPVFFRPSVGKEAPDAFEKYRPEIERFRSRNEQREPPAAEISGKMIRPLSELFQFDPNHLSASDWSRLGLPDKTIHIIEHYREKGGKFFKAEDLARIYGIHEAEYRRLAPYVRIADRMNKQDRPGSFPHGYSFIKKDSPTFHSFHKQTDIIVDINRADAEAWEALPGIGTILAVRIVHFREKLGGFYRIEQVKETYGIPDSVYEKIKACLVIKEDTLRRIDINTATQADLQQHPYIRWELAKAIVNYRSRHGGFRSVDELQQLTLIDEPGFRKLEPYIKIGQ